jgi:hypothetical protein
MHIKVASSVKAEWRNFCSPPISLLGSFVYSSEGRSVKCAPNDLLTTDLLNDVTDESVMLIIIGLWNSCWEGRTKGCIISVMTCHPAQYIAQCPTARPRKALD